MSASAPHKPPSPRRRPLWLHRLGDRLGALEPTTRGLLWSASSGLVFAVLNALMRELTLQLDPFQTQFLRYFAGLLVLLPIAWHHGFANYRPKQVGGQFARGALHTMGLLLWFTALPKIALADMTAIGFTGPIFIMLGAWFFFNEPMRWERWLAAAIGLVGVLIVVGPKLDGSGGIYNLVMLGSAPLFAASFLLTKALTRYESTGVILLWQAITVTLFSLPLALLSWRSPTAWQLVGFAVCGALGSLGHFCLTRSYRIADISATQSVKFLDLLWASALGFVIFGNVPTQSTLLGGLLICAATLWIARRESRGRRAAAVRV